MARLVVSFALRRLPWNLALDRTDRREFSMTATVPRVLVVDDEPQLLRGLRIVLRSAGYMVETARTVLDALARVAEHPPDALVLDLALPDGDGVGVCREVRRCSELPILIISGVGDERDRVRALDAGADDYLAKPFGGEELIARVRALLHREGEDSQSSKLRIGELVIDLARRRVSCAGAVVLLAPVEFDLVRVLALRRGRLVTDGQLLQAVWGPDHGRQTHDLRVRVARLRAKLEKDPSRPEYLITAPGVGYRLCEPHKVLT